jgi:UDP-N-acetylglucosamine pyrophosphorylase
MPAAAGRRLDRHVCIVETMETTKINASRTSVGVLATYSAKLALTEVSNENHYRFRKKVE